MAPSESFSPQKDVQSEEDDSLEMPWLGKSEFARWSEHSAGCRNFEYSVALIRIVRRRGTDAHKYQTDSSLMDIEPPQNGCLHQVLSNLNKLNRKVRSEFINQAAHPINRDTQSLYSRLCLDHALTLRDIPVDLLHLRSTINAQKVLNDVGNTKLNDAEVETGVDQPPVLPKEKIDMMPDPPFVMHTDANNLQCENSFMGTDAAPEGDSKTRDFQMSSSRKPWERIPLHVGGRRRRRALLPSRKKKSRSAWSRHGTTVEGTRRRGSQDTSSNSSFEDVKARRRNRSRCDGCLIGSNKQKVYQSGSKSKSMTVFNLALTPQPANGDRRASRSHYEAPQYKSPSFGPTADSFSERRRQCRGNVKLIS